MGGVGHWMTRYASVASATDEISGTTSLSELRLNGNERSKTLIKRSRFLHGMDSNLRVGDDLRVGQGREGLEGLQNGNAAVELVSVRARTI